MSVSPCLEIHSVTLGLVERNTLFIPITIRDQSGKTVETPALVDSGAGGKFIDQNFARNPKMDIYNLEKPMKALNVDGTREKQGTIKQYVDLTFTINGRPQTQRLLLTGLGKQKIILGFPWLQEQNPIINWKTGEFRWQTRVPDIKNIRRLTEQRWKNEQEAKELKRIPTEELKSKHEELNKTPVEETKESQRVLKRQRNETNKKTNETTYISTIIEKCQAKLQRRKEEAANTPNDMGNIDEPESSPKPKYRSAFIEEIDDEEEFKTHTLNPLDNDDLSILIGLMDSMELEEVWINARTNVATELVEFMGLVTHKRSIGSRHPSQILLPAGPGLHCLGWPSVSSSDMSRSLPATSCTGVRRVSLPRSYPHPLYKVRIIESSELLDSFSVQIVL